MMLIEKISNEEISMIDNYRQCYAYSEDSTCQNGSFIPTKDLLKIWEDAKSQYLYKLFGDGLTLTKHLSFTKSFDELSEEMDCMTDGISQFGRVNRNGSTFSEEFLNLTRRNLDFKNLFGDEDYAIGELSKLMYNETLINNYYDGDDVDIPLPNGKKYKVRNGCKPMRALSKIAEIFNLKGFEDFRICHSQILNQKDIGGDLTISIHPLDYMTMSDNDCGWDSCMSWCNEGGYRQGTVEMMNSKCVIVAYLSAEEPMKLYSHSFWTNKKWRQLFVVDENAILGVKGYPYQNDDLTCAVLEWLRELVKDNLGWTYGDIVKTNKLQDPILLPNDRKIYIRLQTGQMYNDWGCLDNHYVMFNMDISMDKLHFMRYCDEYYYDIDYSGYSQCMVCGDTIMETEFSSESALACMRCQDGKVCDCCGECICGDEYYVIDDMMLCETCYNERIAECAACGEEHYIDYMYQIYVIPRWTSEEMDVLRQRVMERDARIKDQYYNRKNYYDMPEMITINTDYPQFFVCEDATCLNDFCYNYLKEGCRPYLWQVEYKKYFCVYWDDLKESAKDEIYYYPDRAEAFNEQKRFQLYFARMIEQI